MNNSEILHLISGK